MRHSDFEKENAGGPDQGEMGARVGVEEGVDNGLDEGVD